MRLLEQLLGCLPIPGGIGDAFGARSAFHKRRVTRLWSESAAFAIFLLAAVNLLRIGRHLTPAPRPLPGNFRPSVQPPAPSLLLVT